MIQKQLTYFQQLTFDESTKNKAINSLIYGSQISKVCKNGKSLHLRFFYILEDEPQSIQYLSKNKKFLNTRIDLTHLDFIKSDELLINCSLNKANILSIGYNSKVMLLYFESEELRKTFQQGLYYFCKLAHRINDSLRIDYKIAQKIFLRSDKDGDKSLNKSEIKDLLKNLNIQISEKKFQQIANNMKKSDDSYDIDDFTRFLMNIFLKKELMPLFKKYSKEASFLNEFDIQEPLMTLNELNLFFFKEQGEDYTKKIQQLIGKGYFELKKMSLMVVGEEEKVHVEDDWNKPKVTFQAFQTLILNIQNTIFNPEFNKVRNMDRPLTDYYINSSHNTYLIENQLTGKSSISGYISALQYGCRCVELDCWDGENNQPIVYHGHTLTSQLLFEDVIKTINEFAFITNPYPVILSLELHCSYDQQEVMADIMASVFGDKLYILPANFKEFNQYPSPEDLKYKILLKSSGKIEDSAQYLYQQVIESIPDEEDDEDDDDEFEEPEICIIPITQPIQQKQNGQLKKLEEEFKENPKAFQKVEIDNIPFKRAPQQQLSEVFKQKEKEENKSLQSESDEQKSKISLKYVACLAMFNLKFSFLKKRTIWNISSLTENKIESYVDKQLDKICAFTRQNFIRVYPMGTRFDSSNYDPIKSYLCGAQVIAINCQTKDQSMLINHAKFQMNGGAKSGYLLKPYYLLQENAKMNINSSKLKKVKLRINMFIMSGQNLSHSLKSQNDVDSQVKITIRGSKIDEKNNKKQKTQIVPQNGLNPIFNKQFTFEICDPDQAIMLIQVFDEKTMQQDILLGQYAIPVLCIRSGLRVVPMRNQNLEIIDSSYILCKVMVEQLL